MVLPEPVGMSGDAAPAYVRHKPEQTLLYQLLERYWPKFQTRLSETGGFLPRHVTREFEDYLACGRLEKGFLRVRCDGCSHECLVAFSCKRRGFCTSCGARRMVEAAALLSDQVLPHRPIRQWVLSFPYPLRFCVGQSSIGDEQGIGYCEPDDLNALDQQGGLQGDAGSYGCSDVDPALWLSVEHAPAFSCAVY